MRNNTRKWLALLLCLALMAALCGCGAGKAEPEEPAADGPQTNTEPAEEGGEDKPQVDVKAPVIEGLTYSSTQELACAECFRIYRYENGYSVIRVNDGRDYFLVPEGGTVPEGLPSDVIVLQKPLNSIYMAATASMALIDAIDGLESITMSSITADNWYVENAAAAMERGDIRYAGKYSAPDFEMMLEEKCTLAVESTMIWHKPDILEKIEEIGIPVFIDRASYEPNPLGRTEWVKLYGELLDLQDEADAFFAEQERYVRELEGAENTGKTVAFFYVSSTDTVVVRKANDYVSKMISMAGGRYVFDDLVTEDETATATLNMTMEEFYAKAVNADYLIYNATITDPVTSLDDLLAKSDLFANFKAVKDGNVWCTQKSLYQATDEVGTIVSDMHRMLTGDTEGGLTFIYHLN